MESVQREVGTGRVLLRFLARSRLTDGSDFWLLLVTTTDRIRGPNTLWHVRDEMTVNGDVSPTDGIPTVADLDQ